MEQKMMLDEDSSRTIYALRFFLAVLVVMIHCTITIENFPELAHLEKLPVGIDFVQSLFSSYIFTGCAVPLFFVFSGYLLFHVPMNSAADYKKMISKKMRAIVIPYFSWIGLFTVAYVAANLLGLTRKSFFDKTVSEYFGWFLGLPKFGEFFHPVIGQFWYLRDLMLMCALSPLIFKAIQKMPAAYFSAAVLYRLSSLPLSYEWGSAFLYFGIGCFFAQKGITISSLKIKLKDLVIAYSVVIILQCVDYFYENLNGSNLFNLLGFSNIIVGSLLILKIGEWLSKNEKLYSVLKKLSGYSFWIFAVHMPWILSALWRVVKILIPLDGAGFYISYFIVMISTITLSLLSGMLCNKIFPRLFAFLCGGRVAKKN